jgi:hypothetical protein
MNTCLAFKHGILELGTTTATRAEGATIVIRRIPAAQVAFRAYVPLPERAGRPARIMHDSGARRNTPSARAKIARGRSPGAMRLGAGPTR